MRKLERTTGSRGRRPSPLKIESTKVTSHVDDFPDEEQAWDRARFHGFAGELTGVHAAGGDFRFIVAFGTRRSDGPGVSLLFQRIESGIGERLRLMEFQPTRSQARGEKFLKRFASSGDVACFGGAYGGGNIAVGSKIEGDRAAFFPVRGNLQNGRTA